MLGKVIYWMLGGPAIFLGLAYAGMAPLLLLGPAAERAYLVNIAVSGYGGFVLVAATNFAWVGWRLVKASPDPYRNFPAAVWIGAIVLSAAFAAL